MLSDYRNKFAKLEERLELCQSDESLIELLSCAITDKPLLQDGRQLDFKCIVQDGKMQWVKGHLLTNTGASAAGFFSAKFAKQHSLSVVKLANPCKLKLVDDNLAPIVTHGAQMHFRLRDHYDELWCFVTILEKFDLIMEMLWLEKHDPKVSFCTRTLTFDSDHFTAHCLSQGKASVVYSCSYTRVNKDISFKKTWQDGSSTQRNIRHYIAEISVYAFIAMAGKEDYEVAALWPKDFENLDVKIDMLADHLPTIV